MRINILKRGYENLTKAKARLVAHLIGDGSVSKVRHNYQLKFGVRDEESLTQFHDDIITVYGLNLQRWWNILVLLADQFNSF